MRKITVVVINRANYGRIKTVLQNLKKNDNTLLQIAAGGSTLLDRFGKVTNVMTADGLEPDAYVYSVVEGDTPSTMAKSTGLSMIEMSSLFERTQPDVVVTVADRYETLATAATASYMNIPVAHTQGGEVSGSIDESVRHAVTKLANIHFPATERAYDFVLRMGESPEYVFLTGCPSIDLAAQENLDLPDDFFRSRGGVGHEIDQTQPYVVVLQHPVTTEFSAAKQQISETLKAIESIEKTGMQVVWLWPNIDAGSDVISNRLRAFREANPHARIRFYKNFEPEDYLKVIFNSKCLIGNSSSGLRESAFLGIPVVNIGNRQRFREHGPNMVHANHDSSDIRVKVEFQIGHGPYPRSLMFGDGHSGKRIAEILTEVDLPTVKTLSYLHERETEIG